MGDSLAGWWEEENKESGIWKHQRHSPVVWMVAVPEDDLIAV